MGWVISSLGGVFRIDYDDSTPSAGLLVLGLCGPIVSIAEPSEVAIELLDTVQAIRGLGATSSKMAAEAVAEMVARPQVILRLRCGRSMKMM